MTDERACPASVLTSLGPLSTGILPSDCWLTRHIILEKRSYRNGWGFPNNHTFSERRKVVGSVGCECSPPGPILSTEGSNSSSDRMDGARSPLGTAFDAPPRRIVVTPAADKAVSQPRASCQSHARQAVLSLSAVERARRSFRRMIMLVSDNHQPLNVAAFSSANNSRATDCRTRAACSAALSDSSSSTRLSKLDFSDRTSVNAAA